MYRYTSLVSGIGYFSNLMFQPAGRLTVSILRDPVVSIRRLKLPFYWLLATVFLLASISRQSFAVNFNICTNGAAEFESTLRTTYDESTRRVTVLWDTDSVPFAGYRVRIFFPGGERAWHLQEPGIPIADDSLLGPSFGIEETFPLEEHNGMFTIPQEISISDYERTQVHVRPFNLANLRFFGPALVECQSFHAARMLPGVGSTLDTGPRAPYSGRMCFDGIEQSLQNPPNEPITSLTDLSNSFTTAYMPGQGGAVIRFQANGFHHYNINVRNTGNYILGRRGNINNVSARHFSLSGDFDSVSFFVPMSQDAFNAPDSISMRAGIGNGEGCRDRTLYPNEDFPRFFEEQGIDLPDAINLEPVPETVSSGESDQVAVEQCEISDIQEFQNSVSARYIDGSGQPSDPGGIEVRFNGPFEFVEVVLSDHNANFTEDIYSFTSTSLSAFDIETAAPENRQIEFQPGTEQIFIREDVGSIFRNSARVRFQIHAVRRMGSGDNQTILVSPCLFPSFEIALDTEGGVEESDQPEIIDDSPTTEPDADSSLDPAFEETCATIPRLMAREQPGKRVAVVTETEERTIGRILHDEYDLTVTWLNTETLEDEFLNFSFRGDGEFRFDLDDPQVSSAPGLPASVRDFVYTVNPRVGGDSCNRAYNVRYIFNDEFDLGNGEIREPNPTGLTNVNSNCGSSAGPCISVFAHCPRTEEANLVLNIYSPEGNVGEYTWNGEFAREGIRPIAFRIFENGQPRENTVQDSSLYISDFNGDLRTHDFRVSFIMNDSDRTECAAVRIVETIESHGQQVVESITNPATASVFDTPEPIVENTGFGNILDNMSANSDQPDSSGAVDANVCPDASTILIDHRIYDCAGQQNEYFWNITATPENVREFQLAHNGQAIDAGNGQLWDEGRVIPDFGIISILNNGHQCGVVPVTVSINLCGSQDIAANEASVSIVEDDSVPVEDRNGTSDSDNLDASSDTSLNCSAESAHTIVQHIYDCAGQMVEYQWSTTDSNVQSFLAGHASNATLPAVGSEYSGNGPTNNFRLVPVLTDGTQCGVVVVRDRDIVRHCTGESSSQNAAPTEAPDISISSSVSGSDSASTELTTDNSDNLVSCPDASTYRLEHQIYDCDGQMNEYFWDAKDNSDVTGFRTSSGIELSRQGSQYSGEGPINDFILEPILSTGEICPPLETQLVNKCGG